MVCTGSIDDKMVPTEVKGFNDQKIVDVACSSGDGHTVAVDNKGECTHERVCWSAQKFQHNIILIFLALFFL